MLKQELKRIIRNRLIYIGLAAVLIIMSILFYGDVFADNDGDNYLTDPDTGAREHLTRYETIQYQNEACKPYIGHELDDAMIDDFSEIYADIELCQKQFIYKETPIYNIVLEFLYDSCTYSQESAETLGENYRVFEYKGEKRLIPTVKYFAEKNNLKSPIIVNNGAGWINLINNLSVSYIVGLIVISAVLVGVFSSDNRYNIRGMVMATKYGRSKNIAARILSSFITVGCFVTVITLADMLLYFSVYGTGGADTALYMTNLFQGSFELSDMSVFHVFILYVIGGFVVSFAVTAFVLMISALMKYEFTGVITTTAVLILPWIVNQLFVINNSDVNYVLNLLPINIFCVTPTNNGIIWYIEHTGQGSAGIPFWIFVFAGYLMLSAAFIAVTSLAVRRGEDL